MSAANRTCTTNRQAASGWQKVSLAILLSAAAILLFSPALRAVVTASISGTVTDPSGAQVAGATVSVTNVSTGVVTTQRTNGQGYYSFQELALGTYTVDVQLAGFKAYRETGVVLDVNDARANS